MTASASAGERRPARPRRRVARWLVGIALTAISLAFVYPFVWLISASFKPRGEVFDNRILPETFTFDNYLSVWQEAPLALWLANTAFVTVLATVCVTLTSTLVAWGFAYYEFPGRDLLFWLLLGSMMLPGAVTMIPVFLIWNQLDQVGTLTPLWAQNLFGSAFYVFLLRQFFRGLPRSVFEAATVDGASAWTLFRRIALPLSKPALVVTAVFEFQAVWTDLMRPLIYLRDSDTFTVPRGLKAMLDQFGFGGQWHWELVVTAGVVTTVPVVVLFFIAQRHIVRGITAGGGVR
ncbi:multiple sugar transport system permease protein [Stackebrandtia albiflava]|uniref:Multiple sugar transport system permease protein n=1 Tax=Stackebrandtia albiflava TaxID=406432 RepID=A0A562V9Z0_9ACTN|nr:carbohydrate ABC transporter permease [Stackebrandtia albiflava]TWJ14709.1 multiple sugar transport system permease protein [Stackebrandtia albiflava]